MIVTPKDGPADGPHVPPGKRPLTNTSLGSLELTISGIKLETDSSGAVVVSTLRIFEKKIF